MDKIAVGPGVPEGAVSLDATATENLKAVAAAKGVSVEALLVCVLDRPRNEDLIAEIREAGARITLISDGDVSGAVSAALAESGVDMYMGSGGAAEGVLAAAGLRCLGGFLQGRLMARNDDDRAAIAAVGIKDATRILTMADMVPGEALFSATGVTDGALLRGVRLQATSARTSTVVMRSRTGTVRLIDTRHDFTREERE
jgi:fructose-1,6-bisphosphatase II / sedoheptulose-1,7-bisphosphatase